MPRTIRDSIVHPISVRALEVKRVRDVTNGMRRVTLTGAQLGAFVSNGFAQPEFRTAGFDDDVKLVFCYPGDDAPVLPIQKDGSIEFPKGKRPLAKSYTVRHFDAAAGELDIDFVKHGTGVATTWALRCNPGDRVHVAGPARSAFLPRDVDWMLVAGDETALPAIGRLLEEAPAGLRVQAFVEVTEPAHQQEFATEADATVTWLFRGTAAPGTTTLLIDAVRAAQWWPGEVYAWVSGETMSVKPLRRHLVDERGMAKENVEVTGYWRRGEVVTLPDDPAVPDSEQIDDPFDVLHEMGELLPPYALRAAVTLGIPELLARGATSLAELSAATGADATALGKLMRYLVTLEVFQQQTPGRFELTNVGEVLTQEYVMDVLDVSRPVGRQQLAYAGLLDTVRTGKPAYAKVFGQNLQEDRAERAFEAAWHEQLAKYARFLAPALAVDDAIARARRIVVHSDAAGVVAEAIATASANVLVEVAGLPSAVGYFRDDLDASIVDKSVRDRVELVERSLFEPSPDADVVLLIRALDQHPDVDAIHVLRQSAAGLEPDGVVLVVDYPLDEKASDDHAFEEDLKQLVVHGTGHRTDAEHRVLFDRAGLQLLSTRVVGWGFTLYELRRAENGD